MTFAANDLGVLGNLAVALGIFESGPGGGPNPDWFGNPEAFLKNILAKEGQREALLAFVDEAMGGADRTTDPRGVIWLPIVNLGDPDLTISLTVDEHQPDGLHIGLGLSIRTTAPESTTTLAVPLFRATKVVGGVSSAGLPLLLGSPGGRIRIATSIVVDGSAPVPGRASLGAIGIDVDLPTALGDQEPVFGLSLNRFQLPGATTPRDIRISADGLDEIDDALLDLVLSLVKAQADSAPAGSAIASIGGLLGLKSGDQIPDFPITALPAQGLGAIAAWLHALITTPSSRSDWMGYLADLLGGTPSGAGVSFNLGGSAELAIELRVDTGPTGNDRLTPSLGLKLGNDAARVEARADLFQIDLVTGSAVALPQFGIWAASGSPGVGKRVLDTALPTVARADTLRVGFALDSERRLTFVLAADGVVLGLHDYPSLDLTSPGAVMDAVGNTVSDVATQLLGSLGAVLPVVRLLIGLDAPAGVTPITLTALMADPVGACGGYWHDLMTAAPGAATAVLASLRTALADTSEAASPIQGTGTPLDPWCVPLIRPLVLEVAAHGSVLTLGVAVATSVDTLGQRCTVVESRIAATLVEMDLQAKTASLLPGVEGSISARERGISPPRVTLALGEGMALTASGVGLRLGWTPGSGLGAGISAPNLQLSTGAVTIPITLPVIAADGSVSLPAAGWDGVEALVGTLGSLSGGFLRDVVETLGWTATASGTGSLADPLLRLRLADMVGDPAKALGEWLPRVAMSEAGPRALALLADLFSGSGAVSGLLRGSGHPDDPYRLALADDLPNLAVWFPPAGLEPRLVAAPEAIRRWRPGDPGLPFSALEACLQAEAAVAPDIRALIDGRNLAGGLEGIALRWTGGDGRIVPPASAVPGVTLDRAGVAAGQLLEQLDLEDLTGRTPTTTVYVGLGSGMWPEAPAHRRIDLSAPGLAATMFTVPAPAVGDWFIALGGRSDCLLAGSSTDGTPEQAARLARVLDALGAVSSDMVVVAVAGAGHAARLAAQTQTKVTDLITLGTPLGPIALTALSTQPTADAIRLLHRLLPPAPVPGSVDPDAAGEDEDLSLGRALVGSMMELVDRLDPAAELRPPAVLPEAPRLGLAVTAVFGAVSESQIKRALTAIVAAGLALRARARAASPLPPTTGVQAGLRFVLPPTTTGSLTVGGSALLSLFSYDLATGIGTGRKLRLQLRLGDRLGWLTATPDLDLRLLTADLLLPLDGVSPGEAAITLHDARVGGQSWERLVLGTGPEAVPVLPEARILLAAAIQRLTSDVAGSASLQLSQLLKALGLIAPTGGVAGDAVDQLVHDPAGLLRQRLGLAGTEISNAVTALLGPVAVGVDLRADSIRIQGGNNTSGRFGWHADVTASAAGLSGQVRFGADLPSTPAGGLNLTVALNPLQASLQWHQPGGSTDTVALWPSPDPLAVARTVAKAAPSLGGHAALELMRRADDSARPVIDAVLDAFGMLSGKAGDLDRSLRPLAGLLADPAGWFRSADSLANDPAKIQGLFDALRPLLGLAGAPGSPLLLASGVALTVTTAGGGARLSLGVDPTVWTAPGGVPGRLAAGLGASLTVAASGPPSLGIEMHLGLTGAASGRQAVYARLGAGGLELFLRPTSGADIPLIPFAGLGSLAAAAEAALPFLLDRLAEIPGTVGDLVQTVGDAMALRTGAPKQFDGTALRNWANNPVGALTAAVPTIASTGLTAIAPLLDAFVPPAVAVSVDGSVLKVALSGVSLAWDLVSGVVKLVGAGIAVPGVNEVSFTVALSAAGLDELSVTAGPAAIDAGGVTLRPFVTVAAGLSPLGGRRVALGMAVDDLHRFAVRWLLDSHHLDLLASDGTIATAADSVDPTQVALRLVEVMADLVAGVAMAQPAVQDLLNLDVGATDVRNLMRGVVLRDEVNPAALVTGLFDPATVLPRIHKLFSNIAEATILIPVDPLVIAFTKVDGIIGLQAGLSGRFPLVTGDVSLWLENDDSWIKDNPAGDGGLFIGFLPDTLPLQFTPSLVVNGVGLRIGKTSGPLLDVGLTLESIALHAYAAIDGGGVRGGGVQLQFTNLAVPTGGAKGDNGIAQGVMRDSGPTPPKPSFSPALAIQQHGTDPVSVTLRAGDGDGPWWIAIQKGFGPLYLEQIGFGATMPQGRLERISLLMDGSVSMFGLTCAVDDLQITYIVQSGGHTNDFFSPDAWAVDLAGLAVTADIAGVSIAGGLHKQTTEKGTEYLGMLLGRFGVYGITIYGGYGEGEQDHKKFTAFFAVGAVNGPIGGPPAFFLTGIGGGFGINRQLRMPEDLSKFADYPLIQALDIAAQPQEPMVQLRKLGDYFPMDKGTFWFAAGLSFNSFALVDGIAVVAVKIGDGLDISLLGLARMALPRPQVALVSIELALMVRFSSSEGVLWVQGQLTDNSWLLYQDVKLTGGFAYVIWFKGEHRGEFVLTMGGYHPDFHRDGYPQVPRLGLRWSIGDSIVVKAGSYFALTSEALMAGGDFEASAHFGPAWAEVKFGAHGIVYFDPFQYHVNAYSRISAGVTVDTYIFGEVTISVSLGARIDVTGPDFHGSATFEVGPIELTVAFGGSDRAQTQPISAQAFITKYLEAGDGGAAQAHALMTSFGAQPSKGEDATPDGSSTRPFVVVVEFGLTFTSTVPATRVTRSGLADPTTVHPPSRSLGVAPMKALDMQPEVTLSWWRGGTLQTFPFVATPRVFGSFPVGIWGLPQDDDNRKVPKAEMVEALNELDLVAKATESAGGPAIPYYQVDNGPRLPLPFTRRNVDIATLKSQAQAVTALISEPASVAEAFQLAKGFLGVKATPTSLAALRGERQSPPLLGTLTEGLESPAETVIPVIQGRPAGKTYDHFIDPPVAVGLLAGATVDLQVASKARTTVKGSARAWRIAPPTLASVEAERSRSIAARLVLLEPAAVSTGSRGTVIASVEVPPTAIAHAAPAVVARSGAPGADQLEGFTAALVAGRRVARGNSGATLAAGQGVVLKLPNAHADAVPEAERPRLGVAGAPARVVLLGHGGKVLADQIVGSAVADGASGIEIVLGTERIVAIGQGAMEAWGTDAGLSGWHAGTQLHYAGWSTAVAPGCVVNSTGASLRRHSERLDAGWVSGAELAGGVSTVTTTFAQAPSTVVVVLDDPAAFGDMISQRQLLLGLDGADRARDVSGQERPPVLLVMENRSVLAYDISPEPGRPVVVTIASEQGWSLVGVMAAIQLDATATIAMISAQGLDAALHPSAAASTGSGALSRLEWLGPTRTAKQRQQAKRLASGRPPSVARSVAPPTLKKGGRR